MSKNWRPICTAPRDGSEILVCGRVPNDMAVVRWDEDSDRWLAAAFAIPYAILYWRDVPLPPHHTNVRAKIYTGNVGTYSIPSEPGVI